MNSIHTKFLVIGASGLVGKELISILLERSVDPNTIIATASRSSAGKAIEVSNVAFVLNEIEQSLFDSSPLVFQCATNEAAMQWIPVALNAGCQVIDCSSVYRQDSGVPLVIPSVNSEELKSNPQLIACPNCTTIILLTAIHRLQTTFDVKSITVATYQALSGAGREGLEALQSESSGKPPTQQSVFPEPCAFNVFCHESNVNQTTGFNGEEEKVISEVHKICEDSTLQIFPTCMRVPVERVHTESITLTINGLITKDEVLRVLHSTDNVLVLNDEGHFPTALKASGGDVVLVGHIRVVPHQKSTTVSLVACGDQIRTGAALNAVRIVQKLSEVAAI